MAAGKNCEIVKAISDFSSGSSSSEDSDFDDIFSSSHSSSLYSMSDNWKSSGKQQKSLHRLPTRRPDPNVCNRNALLARENRRRKKAYVETLEKELDAMKYTNKKLNKLLRKHMKMVKKLENEKQHYKGLISNQSDIFNLVSVLNTKSVFIPKAASSYSPTDSNRSTSSSEQQLLINNDYDHNDSRYEPYTETNWDQLLGMDECLLPQSGESTSNRCDILGISGEHNYFSNHEEDSGVCLHNTVEYCPTCHVSAKQPNTIPDQLLVVD